jgi:hypothetical protein
MLSLNFECLVIDLKLLSFRSKNYMKKTHLEIKFQLKLKLENRKQNEEHIHYEPYA